MHTIVHGPTGTFRGLIASRFMGYLGKSSSSDKFISPCSFSGTAVTVEE